MYPRYCIIPLKHWGVTRSFSSASLCQQSSWNRNSSIVRPSVCGIYYLWTYCVDFFQILVLASLGHMPGRFWSFEKKNDFWIFYKYFLFSLTWDHMGAKTSKRHSSLKSLLNFWNFGFFIFHGLFFTLTWETLWSQNFKMLLLAQITFEFFLIFFSWIFFSLVLTKVLFWIFEILSLRFFFAN